MLCGKCYVRQIPFKRKCSSDPSVDPTHARSMRRHVLRRLPVGGLLVLRRLCVTKVCWAIPRNGKSRSPVDRSSLLPRRLGGRRMLRALGLPLLHLVRFVRCGVEIDKPVEGLGVPDSQGRPTDTRFGASRILRDALLTPDFGRPGFSGTPTSPFENGRGSADRARRTVNAKRATRIVTVAGRRYNPLSLLQGSPVRNSRFNAR